MKTKSKFLRKVFLQLIEYCTVHEKPVAIFLKDTDELNRLQNAVADAAAYTGEPYTTVIDNAQIMTYDKP